MDIKHLFLAAVSALLMMTACETTAVTEKFDLKFNSEGQFKICQFTDLHIYLNEEENTQKTFSVVKSVVKQEQPDLIVLSGDVVTGDPAIKGWKAFTAMMDELKTPYLFVPGNHDDEIITTKDSIFAVLTATEYFAGKTGPEELKGMGNCALPVYSSKGDKKVKAVVYGVDSGQYPVNPTHSYYDWIGQDQVRWYRETSAGFTADNGGNPVPSMMFMHIPLPEYREINPDDIRSYGERYEDVCNPELNSGMFLACVESKDIMGISCGHDHDNDLAGIYKGIALTYGRATGFSTYGQMEKGGRVFVLYEDQRVFETYIVTEKGRQPVYYYPSGFNSEIEANSQYLPAIDVNPSKNGVAYKYFEGEIQNVKDLYSVAKLVKEGTLDSFSLEPAQIEDHFGFEFTSYLKVPVKGIYSITLASDDGAVLSIDGREIVNNDGSHSMRAKENCVPLEAGFHKLQILYFEDTEGCGLKIQLNGRQFSAEDQDKYFYLPE